MTDIVVHQARWVPVTAGDFDRRTGVVSVNLAVVDAVLARFGDAPATVIAAIVAHERAHAGADSEVLSRAEDEAVARQAAIAAAGAAVVAHIDAVLNGAWA